MGFDKLNFEYSGDPGPLIKTCTELLCDCGFYVSAKTDDEADKLFKDHKHLVK